VDSGFKPITMEQQLASDGQVTVMQAVPAGAGGQQVQVNIFSELLNEIGTQRLIRMKCFLPVLITKTCVPKNLFNM
jgi:hypothetical protein